MPQAATQGHYPLRPFTYSSPPQVGTLSNEMLGNIHASLEGEGKIADMETVKA